MTLAFQVHAQRLRSWIGVVSLGITGGIGAQIINPLDEVAKEGDDQAVMNMLVEGSILQGVMVPRYDESHRLTAVLRAAKLTMVDSALINAEKLRIEFFDPDRSPKARIDLATAKIEDQKIIRSSEPVSLVSDELNLKGSGLVYDLMGSRGFLNGPAEGSTLIKTHTSMKSSPKQLSAVAGAMMAAAVGVQADGLKQLDEQQLTGLDNLAASKKTEAEAAAKQADISVANSDIQSEEADETLGEFLREASIDIPSGQIPDLTTQVPAPDSPEAAEPATFSAEDGIYFDSEKGLLVFLKNVEVRHPDFSLTGADEVKVFLDTEEKKDDQLEKIDQEESNELLGGAKFGDPSKIIATGTIVVEKIKTEPDGKSARASGRQIVFDFKTNEVILRGGQPWIMSDSIEGRILDPDGYIRINVETGDASFVGRSEGLIDASKQKK